MASWSRMRWRTPSARSRPGRRPSKPSSAVSPPATAKAWTPPARERLQEALERLNRRLVADIRAGRLDGNREIARHLFATAVDAVRESNPKYLRSRGIE